MLEPNYIYTALITKVVDGDTVHADVDVGFFVTVRNQVLRLARINTPELRGLDKGRGQMVRDYVRKMIEGQQVRIQTYKDAKGSYGRWLADIWVKNLNLNDELLRKGYAEHYKG